MTFQKLLGITRNLQPNISTELLEKTYNLLKKLLNDLAFAEKRQIHNQSLERAQTAAEHQTDIEFICAALLVDLIKRNKNLEKIARKKLNANIGLILKSFAYARAHLPLEPPKEACLNHAYQTALAVAKVHAGTTATCAALLQDIPQQTPDQKRELTKIFGADIVTLIEKFQKIRILKTASNQPSTANLREMVLGMTQDLRVVILKMCSNLDYLKNAEADKITPGITSLATESLEILSPIADLLGAWHLRWQMEDEAFRLLEPEAFKEISRRFDIDEKKNREKYIQKTRQLVLKACQEQGVECEINGRFKHFYAIYQKMKRKQKKFNEIRDVFALRVIVNQPDDCYRVLGLIHSLWKPVPGRVKDYIAAPKSNQYRSLHTTVFGLNGRATEFQIRTKEMDETARFGIAAQWNYKNQNKKTPDWIQEILDKQQKFQNDKDFINNFYSEILANRIYVYTPKSDVLALPVGATPLDFAYLLHSEVGHHCIGAKVNGEPYPLNHPLKNNDVVEIITDRQAGRPQIEWLNFVKSSGARKHIESYFNKYPVERSFRL